ncbi:MAG TPA: helix-turn-helix domain-containing protein [Microlunatus sp.]|nr:helix-turn-helix domain-containing protein [Microlunatus sp.]
MTTAPGEPGLSVLRPGLWVHRGGAPAMGEFHRHDDLELNVVLDGELHYLFGGERLVVSRGHTALFWAAAPHRLLTADLPGNSDVCWLHVPLQTVLRWTLPAAFGTEILAQRTVVVPTAALGEHVEAQFATWHRDLGAGAGAGQDSDALLLEANALVLRILAQQTRGAAVARTATRPDLQPVAAMAGFTAERFRDPISTADIARAAGLTPNYATTLFRESVGSTLGEHLLRHRIAEAQRLLITTTMTTSAVAHAAGFGSSSSLYAHFTRACGCAPGEYRAARVGAGAARPAAATGGPAG